MSRARSVEIYLKPGIEEDDQVHEIWVALRGRARPQDVFRRALRLGIRSMAEAGELPRAALEALDPDLLGAPGPARALLARGVRARVRQAQLKAEPVASAELSQVEVASATQRQTPRQPSPPIQAAPVPFAGTPAPSAVPERKRLGRIM